MVARDESEYLRFKDRAFVARAEAVWRKGADLTKKGVSTDNTGTGAFGFFSKKLFFANVHIEYVQQQAN